MRKCKSVSACVCVCVCVRVSGDDCVRGSETNECVCGMVPNARACHLGEVESEHISRVPVSRKNSNSMPSLPRAWIVGETSGSQTGGLGKPFRVTAFLLYTLHPKP